MLISKVLEKTEKVTAAENMASRLADRVRNIWMENKQAGYDRWEECFFEDPDGVNFLRSESFPKLQGVEYVFKWWGSEDPDGLAGVVEVLWKVQAGEAIDIYKSWIRLSPGDFILGAIKEESQKREVTRAAFRKAFADWQKIYVDTVNQ